MTLPENQRKLDTVDALAALAEEAGITPIEMALAFFDNPALAPKARRRECPESDSGH